MVVAMNFDNLVAVLAIAAAVPLILAAVPRVPVPGPVLEIVAGIVLGPAVLNLVKPDQAVRLVSTIGLAFLLFLAGLEVDVRHFRGPRARLAALALGLSALLALTAGFVLHAAGIVESPLLVGIILLATSLGVIIPILNDAGVADRPVGQFAIAGASLGELSPLHRRRHDHRASGARHRAGQRGRTRRRGAVQRHPFPVISLQLLKSRPPRSRQDV